MSNATLRPAGQAWLFRHLGLSSSVPRPAVESYVVAGARRTESDGCRTRELFPSRYAPDNSVIGHMRFALRHEAFDLGVLVAALRAIEPNLIEAWVRSEPTGSFSRRAWFLYETFTGRTLDLADARSGNYVGALNPLVHVSAPRRNSRRHRVADNLLGVPALCPTVRWTNRLRAAVDSGLDTEASGLTESTARPVLRRAASYLYAKETHSSFEIEGETPGTQRAMRFVAALKEAGTFDLGDKAALIRLHVGIVEPRFAEHDWRKTQNFVGETLGGYRERVHYVCPRPADVPPLMRAWTGLAQRLVKGGVDPVVAAAVVSFSFVFIHPFEDGNGRIHRFLIHAVLGKLRYGPRDAILPVSAAFLRDRHGYDRVLAGFSQPVLDLVRWEWVPGSPRSPGREISVSNETVNLYRYFDATAFAEYLYDRLAGSVRHDQKEELGFVEAFERALGGIRDIVDMPDRRASLLVRLCMQNDGRLAARKRARFAELTDDEVRAMERAVQRAMAGN